MQKNVLIRKISLISKYKTPKSVKQAIAMHRLSNISRSKGNQKMKFGQLIEYDIRNNTQNVAEKLFPDSFLINQN